MDMDKVEEFQDMFKIQRDLAEDILQQFNFDIEAAADFLLSGHSTEDVEMVDVSSNEQTPPLPPRSHKSLSFNINFFTDDDKLNSVDFHLDNISENRTVGDLKDLLVDRYREDLATFAANMGMRTEVDHMKKSIRFEGMQNPSDFHDSATLKSLHLPINNSWTCYFKKRSRLSSDDVTKPESYNFKIRLISNPSKGESNAHHSKGSNRPIPLPGITDVSSLADLRSMAAQEAKVPVSNLRWSVRAPKNSNLELLVTDLNLLSKDATLQRYRLKSNQAYIFDVSSVPLPSTSKSNGSSHKSSRSLRSTKKPFVINVEDDNDDIVREDIEDDEDDYPVYEISDDEEPALRAAAESTNPQNLPLIPENLVNNPVKALENFFIVFVQRYCNEADSGLPSFCLQNFSEAFAQTLGVQRVCERKPMLIYLHHDRSIASNIFCSKVLCSNVMSTFLEENNLQIWPWDVTSEAGRGALLGFLEPRLSIVASEIERAEGLESYPLLIMICKVAGTYEIAAILTGHGFFHTPISSVFADAAHAIGDSDDNDGFPPLMDTSNFGASSSTRSRRNRGGLNAQVIVSQLEEKLQLYYRLLAPERLADSERLARENMREEQDRAYKESLRQDRLKRKPMLIYLHHDRSIASNIFCSKVLCSNVMSTFLEENNLQIWPWDVTSEAGRGALLGFLEPRLSIVASEIERAEGLESYPLLIMICKVAGTYEIAAILTGHGFFHTPISSVFADAAHAIGDSDDNDGFPPLMDTSNFGASSSTRSRRNRGGLNAQVIVSQLEEKLQLYYRLLAPERLADSERLARENMREEQDRAYKESLRQDRLKKEAREKELAELAAKEAEAQRIAEESERAALEKQKLAAEALPKEPSQGTPGIATLRFRLPQTNPQPPALDRIPEESRPQITNGFIVRRFNGLDTLRDLKNFMEFLGYGVQNFKLLRTYPRVDNFSEAFAQTLGVQRVCERKPMLIYLHHDRSIASNIFCSKVLCSNVMSTFLEENNLQIWPWDVTSEAGRGALLGFLEPRLSIVASEIERAEGLESYPLLIMICKVAGTYEIAAILTGHGFFHTPISSVFADAAHAIGDSDDNDGFPPLMDTSNFGASSSTRSRRNRGGLNAQVIVSQLEEKLQLYYRLLAPERLADSERLARENMREEQDRAYKESLRQDRLKKEAREKELAELAAKEAEAQRIAEESERAALEKQKLAAEALPKEPSQGTPGIATLRFRLPQTNPQPPALDRIPEESRPQITNGFIVRRFNGLDTLRDLKNFMEFLGYGVQNFKLLRTYPRVDLTASDESDYKSMVDLKLVPQETLNLEKR
nr:hypothetical transcript [Hymenolepis microstoma]